MKKPKRLSTRTLKRETQLTIDFLIMHSGRCKDPQNIIELSRSIKRLQQYLKSLKHRDKLFANGITT